MNMIRFYFAYRDPVDEEGIGLSYVDVRTEAPQEAFQKLEKAAESGDLWRILFPGDERHPQKLIRTKAVYLDISGLPAEHRRETTLNV